MCSWLSKHWYQQAKPALLLRLIASLYQAIISLRHSLYRYHIFKQTRLPVPVIMVGNITVGGTGKTPLVIQLAQLLLAQGFHPAVVSRGYGRQHNNPMRVQKEMSVALVGDEPLMMSQHLSCPIWVGAKRSKTAQMLLAESPEVDVIISDDGLQHYAMARDIELVVFDAERGIGNGYLLPAGPLREPVSRVSCADYVVINGKSLPQWPWLKATATAMMQLQVGKLHHLNAKQTNKTLAAFKGKNVHAVAGIGNPTRFFNTLRDQGILLTTHIFDDHHDFQLQDFANMQDAPIIMTEKDAVKCQAFGLPQAWYLPITASLPQELIEWLVNRLHFLRGQHG